MKMTLFSKLQLMQVLESGITFKLENIPGGEVQHKTLHQPQKCHCRVTEVSLITVYLYCEGVGNSCYFIFFKQGVEEQGNTFISSFPSSTAQVFQIHGPGSHFSYVRYTYILYFDKNQCLNRTQ